MPRDGDRQTTGDQIYQSAQENNAQNRYHDCVSHASNWQMASDIYPVIVKVDVGTVVGHCGI